MKRNLPFILVLLSLLMLYAWLRQADQRQQEKDFSDFQEPLLVGIDEADIAEISLELPQGRETIRLVDGKWRLPFHDNHLANDLYVQLLVDTLLTTPRGSIISENVNSHKKYGVDAQARVIIVKDKNSVELSRIYVGKPGLDHRSTYVRLRDKPEVRFVTIDLIPITSRSTWADTYVWRMVPSSIQGISIRAGNEWRHWKRDQDSISLPNNIVELKAANILWQKCAVPAEPQFEVLVDVGAQPMQLSIWRDDLWKGSRSDASICFLFSDGFVEILQTLVEEADP